jgi:5-methylcytosine-specific restriction protein A
LKAWQHAAPVKRITGWKLQKMRRALFQAEPLCVECKAAGRVALATIRDHVIPLAEGGLDEAENTQGLCEACHEIKSQAEAMRGRARVAT